jgi:branched-chain amino acid transport system substrate-binding protein
VGGLSAGDLSTFLKQWNELGMKGKIPFVEIAIGDTDIWAVGPEAASGTFTKMWYYNNPANPPEERAFAAAYLKKYGKPAADKAWMGWITARSLFESIDAAKSLEADAIIAALEAWKVPIGAASYSYRKFDHQMLVRNLAVSVKEKITDKWDYFDVKATLPENPADLDKVFGSQEEIGCKMG